MCAFCRRPPYGRKAKKPIHRLVLQSRFPVLLAVLFLTALCSGLSCDEDPASPCPVYEVGALEGYVLAAGEGIAAIVGARSADYTTGQRARVEVFSDSTGWYRIELPVGLYYFRIRDQQTLDSQSEWESIEVGPGTQQLEFRHGCLTAHIECPAELDGRSVHARLFGVEHQIFSQSRADAEVQDGRIELTFPLVKAGSYYLGLSLGYPTLYLPGVLDWNQADTITVSDDDPTTYDGSLDYYATISGSAAGSWQVANVSPPSVVAWSDDIRSLDHADVADDGSFRIEMLTPGAVRLSVRRSGIDRWIGGESFATATRFELQSGEHITDISLIGSGIRCGFEGPGYAIEQRVEIVLHHEAGHRFRDYSSWGNQVSICNLPAGRYVLFVYGTCAGEPWAGQWYDGVNLRADATPIDLDPGELVSLTIHLHEGGRIEGCVLDADGAPALDARIQAFDAEGEPLCHGWQYTDDGCFVVTGLADGDFYVAAEACRREFWYYPGTWDRRAAQPISIIDHATVTGIEWRLPEE
ncbi:MAG: carboxypeptidase regulatory-like domain-containing protein [Candidatus Eisenbacteria sp.]|nr:carboxypeptidase regulatory-like domain-containing protein [Candidatus Eisenbacteria bacterium]